MSNSIFYGNEATRIHIHLHMLVDRWKREGATHQDIRNELDGRILFAAQQWFKLWLNRKEKFRLFPSGVLALKYGYTILKNNGHLPDWTTVDFKEAEAEWSRWQLMEVYKKSELVRCVLVLGFFAEIQMQWDEDVKAGRKPEPFVVKPP